MEENIQWFIVQNNTKHRVSKSDRTCGVMENGEILLSAHAFGGEKSNMLAMAFDGIPFTMMGGAMYCPASWLKMEHPEMADDISAIVKRVLSQTKARIGAN